MASQDDADESRALLLGACEYCDDKHRKGSSALWGVKPCLASEVAVPAIIIRWGESTLAILKSLKTLALQSANVLGASSIVMNSSWRQQRLLILCYHGISLNDEHLWNPFLYMPSSLFHQRLNALRSNRCNVLRLSEGLERLYSGTLPPRSVVLTFDDGYSDFATQALPALIEYGFPATVYLTTYYSQLNRPVFDVMSRYILWKARGQKLDWREVVGGAVTLNAAERARTAATLKSFARRQRLSGIERDDMLNELSSRLAIDYHALCQRRILFLLTPQELTRALQAGMDIQLHTHRHRIPPERAQFVREIEENRQVISQVSSNRPVHFCYPNGVNQPHIADWLEELEIRSAVTFEPGLASAQGSRMRLPRVSDSANMTMTEFSSWISGEASWLPRWNFRAFNRSPTGYEDPVTASA
jgi:peptidoglycan/xylan/chitin deacetylase (PgdA/CDA1 family)